MPEVFPMAKQKSKAVRVQILNPVADGRDSTSLAHARRYERQGRARFISEFIIEFVEADHRHQAAQETIGGRNVAPKNSPWPLPVCGNLSWFTDQESMRTFARYPEVGAFLKAA